MSHTHRHATLHPPLRGMPFEVFPTSACLGIVHGLFFSFAAVWRVGQVRAWNGAKATGSWRTLYAAGPFMATASPSIRCMSASSTPASNRSPSSNIAARSPCALRSFVEASHRGTTRLGPRSTPVDTSSPSRHPCAASSCRSPSIGIANMVRQEVGCASIANIAPGPADRPCRRSCGTRATAKRSSRNGSEAMRAHEAHACKRAPTSNSWLLK